MARLNGRKMKKYGEELFVCLAKEIQGLLRVVLLQQQQQRVRRRTIMIRGTSKIYGGNFTINSHSACYILDSL